MSPGPGFPLVFLCISQTVWLEGSVEWQFLCLFKVCPSSVHVSVMPTMGSRAWVCPWSWKQASQDEARGEDREAEADFRQRILTSSIKLRPLRHSSSEKITFPLIDSEIGQLCEGLTLLCNENIWKCYRCSFGMQNLPKTCSPIPDCPATFICAVQYF